MHIHMRERSFSYEVCDKTFIDTSSLNREY